MATMTRSLSDGVRSWGCDGPAHPDHYRAGGRGGGGRGRGDLVPACVRAGALARGVRDDGAAAAVHRGRADLGRVHGGTRCQPPEPAASHGWCSLEPSRHQTSWPRSIRFLVRRGESKTPCSCRPSSGQQGAEEPPSPRRPVTSAAEAYKPGERHTALMLTECGQPAAVVARVAADRRDAGQGESRPDPGLLFGREPVPAADREMGFVSIVIGGQRPGGQAFMRPAVAADAQCFAEGSDRAVVAGSMPVFCQRLALALAWLGTGTAWVRAILFSELRNQAAVPPIRSCEGQLAS